MMVNIFLVQPWQTVGWNLSPILILIKEKWFTFVTGLYLVACTSLYRLVVIFNLKKVSCLACVLCHFSSEVTANWKIFLCVCFPVISVDAVSCGRYVIPSFIVLFPLKVKVHYQECSSGLKKTLTANITMFGLLINIPNSLSSWSPFHFQPANLLYWGVSVLMTHCVLRL